MPNPTETFAARLQELESSRDVDAFVTAVFAEDVTLLRPEPGQELSGRDGARTFWQDYLATFARVSSTFSRVHDGEVGVLEWSSDAQLNNGSDITYRGVSVLDLDDQGKVTRFATRLFQP